ncbi:MAG TPA: hypothetical protein DCS93_01855 [Microscillaceae bacterium]|nr:hypothetical protein [Microscillaceae bacterium]
MSKIHLHSDKYLEALYDKKLNLVEFYWKNTTEDLTEAEYRMIVSDIVDKVVENVENKQWKAPNWLLDNRDFLFTISPELQQWQAKKIFEPVSKFTKKAAFVMSEDLVTQFAIEQTYDEHKEAKMLTQYFIDLHQANEWLQEGDN